MRIKSHLDHFTGRKSYVKGLPKESILNCTLGTNPFGVSEKVLLAARNYHWERLIGGLKQRGYLVSKTLNSCPIFVLGYPDESLDLEKQLLTKGILTESGKDFRDLESNYVRVNIPLKADDFLDCL